MSFFTPMSDAASATFAELRVAATLAVKNHNDIAAAASVSQCRTIAKALHEEGCIHSIDSLRKVLALTSDNWEFNSRSAEVAYKVICGTPIKGTKDRHFASWDDAIKAVDNVRPTPVRGPSAASLKMQELEDKLAKQAATMKEQHDAVMNALQAKLAM